MSSTPETRSRKGSLTPRGATRGCCAGELRGVSPAVRPVWRRRRCHQHVKVFNAMSQRHDKPAFILHLYSRFTARLEERETKQDVCQSCPKRRASRRRVAASPQPGYQTVQGWSQSVRCAIAHQRQKTSKAETASATLRDLHPNHHELGKEGMLDEALNCRSSRMMLATYAEAHGCWVTRQHLRNGLLQL